MSFSLRRYWKPKGGWSELDWWFSSDDAKKLESRLGSLPQGSFSPDPPSHIFRAFEMLAPEEVNVVILGQDPYHDGSASGLAFSAERRGPVRGLPPSLEAIYHAIEADCGKPPKRTGDLTPWVEDKVLLLNTVLTVGDTARSHATWSWQSFTQAALKLLSTKREGVVFLLWGEDAWKAAREAEVAAPPNYLLPAHHPQARKTARLSLARSRHFTLTNLILANLERNQIRWRRA